MRFTLIKKTARIIIKQVLCRSRAAAVPQPCRSRAVAVPSPAKPASRPASRPAAKQPAGWLVWLVLVLVLVLVLLVLVLVPLVLTSAKNRGGTFWCSGSCT